MTDMGNRLPRPPRGRFVPQMSAVDPSPPGMVSCARERSASGARDGRIRSLGVKNCSAW